MASDEFAARAQKLFGSLGDETAAAGGWHLNTQQGFAAGAEDQDSSEEDEGAEAGPQSLPGAAGSDEDEDEYRAKASLQYCAAFEAEAEEDEYDLLAAGQDDEETAAAAAADAAGGQRGSNAQRKALQRSMQVLDDNAYDRAHHHRPQQQQQQEQQQQHASGVSAMEVEGCAGSPTIDQTAPAAAKQQPAAGGVIGGGSGGGGEGDADQQQQQQQSAKRMKPRGGVWVPPHRRPDYRPPEQHQQQDSQQQQELQQHPRPQQQQQRQQWRRVTFSEDAVPGDNSNSKPPQRQPPQQQQQPSWGRPPGVGGPGRGRGRRGGRGGVPDHVVNPHKYTVYVLDEPLFVGQGGADVESEAAASTWQQQQQDWGHHQQQQQQRPNGKASKLDANSRREIEEPVEQLRVGGQAPGAAAAVADAAGVAAMEVEETPAAAPAQLPTPGAIKFAPTGHVRKASKPKQQRSTAGSARGAFCEDVDADDLNVEEAPAAVSGPKSSGRARQYRSRAE